MRHPASAGRSAVLLLLVLGLVGLSGLVAPERAYACSCAGISTARALAEADAAFVGTVTAIGNNPQTQGRLTDIRFEVAEVYKGEVFADQVVTTDADPSSCGLMPQVGREWTVFATHEVIGSGDRAVTRLRTGLCSGNLPGPAAPGALRDGEEPVPGASDRAERADRADDRVNRLLVGVGRGSLAVLLLAGGALGLVWTRRRR